MEINISTGFDEAERNTVARLYWRAFGQKLGRVLGPDDQALAFLCAVLDPAFALVAQNGAGEVIGVAGFTTSKGALVGGQFSDLTRHYGYWGGTWRALTLSVLERAVPETLLLMDGICVSSASRGLGAGAALLSAIKSKSSELELNGVRLDVIDTNPRARKLYEREGFVAHRTEHTGPFKYLFKFDKATQMIWRSAPG